MTGSEIAEQWSKLFVLKSFDGEQRVVFTPESRDTEGRSILSGVMRDLNMGQDFLYTEVWNALEAIAENGLEDVEDNLCEYCDTEVDVYTADLTAWLASDVHHIYYLDDATRGNARDGAQVLMQAQGQAIEEIWQAVIQAVQEELDKSSDLCYDDGEEEV